MEVEQHARGPRAAPCGTSGRGAIRVIGGDLDREDVDAGLAGDFERLLASGPAGPMQGKHQGNEGERARRTMGRLRGLAKTGIGT